MREALGVIFALLTSGMNAQQREQMLEQLAQPINAEQVNVKLAKWKREVFGGA